MRMQPRRGFLCGFENAVAFVRVPGKGSAHVVISRENLFTLLLQS